VPLFLPLPLLILDDFGTRKLALNDDLREGDHPG
jgi:hypothetical protein